ncbi:MULTISPECIES: acireductone synthase [Metallibacterium]|jgi:enolase-phosphatase E1|uniref:acireductone synthase n=1 Tax=Metallibacterium TaxID=1218803 RepID=UPI002639827D|nr:MULTISPECIES: acireductone synthase [Metallibacterium]MBW8074117.1 acireductone synthase [Metallibacterium scheffleri]
MTGAPAPGVVLTDIEGTTSDIRFVQQVLFPYARRRLPAWIAAHANEPEVGRWLDAAAREAGLATPAARDTVVEALLAWIDADRKSTALKALQGMIWREGYAAGDFVAHVYPDVEPALRAWRARGLRLFVYSSGSIEAQKQFFAHSAAGDLTPLFDGYFDTETGPKREAASYTRIARAIGAAPQAVLFLSDIEAELDAARAAGMQTTQLCRPPAACAAACRHPCAHDFTVITLPSAQRPSRPTL